MRKIVYHIGRLNKREELRLDFEDGISRSVEERVELGFIPLKTPVIDSVYYRIFNTLKEYRNWADKSLPKWLGYNTK